MNPRAIVITGYGINCDRELADAFAHAGAQANLVHVNELSEHPGQLRGYQIVALPGGFSFGDGIFAGQAMAVRLRSQLEEKLSEHVEQGGLVLGVCNGCQIGSLLNLAPHTQEAPEVAFTYNDSGKFEDRGMIHVTEVFSRCIWTRRVGLVQDIPIAHGEGKFVAPVETYTMMESERLIALRYADREGNPARGRYPINPNGSMGDVAGITDMTGRVLLLMPHPERHHEGYQRSGWTRIKSQIRREGRAMPEPGGLKILRNGVNYFR